MNLPRSGRIAALGIFLTPLLAGSLGAQAPGGGPSAEDLLPPLWSHAQPSALREQVARAAGPAGEEHEIQAVWKDGLVFRDAARTVEVRLGGRIHLDNTWVNGDAALNAAAAAIKAGSMLADGTEFRNARLYVSGRIRKRLEFKAQFNFTSGTADFKDVYVGLLDVGPLSFRAGQFKEPFSLNELTSSNYITFMERSLANVFSPSRSTGAMVHGSFLGGDRGSFALGAFRDSGKTGKFTGKSDEWNFTGRVTGLPWYQESDGVLSLVHIGAGASYRMMSMGTLTLGTGPEAHLLPKLAQAKVPLVDDYILYNAEVAGMFGPLNVQGEFLALHADAAGFGAPDANLTGHYLQASWFLTDDQRRYKKSAGAFSGVKPAHPLFSAEGGGGAIELKLRYSGLDLTGGGYSSAKLHDLTAGVNWYLNDNFRMMFEVISTRLRGVGSTQIFQVRTQVAF